MTSAAVVLETTDPATGEIIAEVPEMGREALDLYTDVKSVWVSLS